MKTVGSKLIEDDILDNLKRVHRDVWNMLDERRGINAVEKLPLGMALAAIEKAQIMLSRAAESEKKSLNIAEVLR